MQNERCTELSVHSLLICSKISRLSPNEVAEKLSLNKSAVEKPAFLSIF
jgi:hypothetical protein